MNDQLWAGVKDRVEALASMRPTGARPVFGANGHRFHLEPVLSPVELAELEAQIGVGLPEEYRSFLTTVGAGGAGPAYGVFPVQRQQSQWQWTGDGAELADLTRLAEPFPAQGPDPAVVEALLQQAPQEEDIDDEEDFDTAYEEWAQRWTEVMWNPQRTVGAIAVCHLGCALREWLVISGPERGRIWSDARADDVDLVPLLDEAGQPMTFGRWYLGWLDRAEKQTRSQQA